MNDVDKDRSKRKTAQQDKQKYASAASMSGVLASPLFHFSSLQSKNHSPTFSYGLYPLDPNTSSLPDTKLKKQLGFPSGTPTRQPHGISVRCNSSTRPGSPGSGDNESSSVLDAFFLGKALAEAVNERIESTVGEFLSAIGRLQAEQQRQIQDFQVDVLERAKKAKKNAAKEALEAQGLVPNATAVDPKLATYGFNSKTSSSTSKAVTPANSPSSSNSTVVPTAETRLDPAAKGPAYEVIDDD
ncbi:uncharacterized protein At4g13200, chloroplastic [Hevea brasiliensis]|uniref:uncharacterized protein At4g13200, chloroplastic n=1 Tax=Hevea brasiliensis TaxID=3981 RepID=UPI0025DDCF4C|nr:uncharacterized protein At4g13200, chloroplastic [Hevea brasiliensis]